MSAFDLLLPRPVSVTPAVGGFTLDRAAIDVDEMTADAGTWLAAIAGCRIADDGVIRFRHDPSLPAEGYRLTITPTNVLALAADSAGAHYAAQTMRQLLGPNAFRAANRSVDWTLPCGEVTDRPRFAWRGCLLDVARHFMPKAGVLRFIDLLAAHRLNVLHLHLTDDQGWRLDVPGFPRLVEIGGWRTESRVGTPPAGQFDGRPHGGYYTTDDLREIVAYAADRAITVVPEVDIPGHTQAAIAAYPELGNTGDRLPVWTS